MWDYWKVGSVKHFLNLTNGIEAIKKYDINLEKCHFINIKSTYCEQKLWDKILVNLDNDFLLNLAIGNECIIYDFSNKKKIPRSVWQGIPFIEYILNIIWFRRKTTPFVRGINVQNYFWNCYKELSNSTISKIKYYRKFLNTNNIKIRCICDKTNLDGKYAYYKDILLNEN